MGGRGVHTKHMTSFYYMFRFKISEPEEDSATDFQVFVADAQGEWHDDIVLCFTFCAFMIDIYQPSCMQYVHGEGIDAFGLLASDEVIDLRRKASSAQTSVIVGPRRTQAWSFLKRPRFAAMLRDFKTRDAFAKTETYTLEPLDEQEELNNSTFIEMTRPLADDPKFWAMMLAGLLDVARARTPTKRPRPADQ